MVTEPNSCRTSVESDGGSTSATSSSVASAAHSGGPQTTLGAGRAATAAGDREGEQRHQPRHMLRCT